MEAPNIQLRYGKPSFAKAQQVVEHIESGMGFTEACQQVHCKPTSIWRYIKADKHIKDLYDHACEVIAENDVITSKTMVDDEEDSGKANAKLKAVHWRASRWNRERYGDAVQVTTTATIKEIHIPSPPRKD